MSPSTGQVERLNTATMSEQRAGVCPKLRTCPSSWAKSRPTQTRVTALVAFTRLYAVDRCTQAPGV